MIPGTFQSERTYTGTITNILPAMGGLVSVEIEDTLYGSLRVLTKLGPLTKALGLAGYDVRKLHGLRIRYKADEHGMLEAIWPI